MPGTESVVIAVISAIIGGVIAFFAQYTLPPILIERVRERRELMRAFRKNAVPLMYASYQLFRRLQNILDDGMYEALACSWRSKPYWPMTHDYFVESTLYLFGAYFACIERYYLDSSLHLAPGSQRISRRFHRVVRSAQRALYDVSLNGEHSPDHQVYLLDQKAMGEALLLIDETVSAMGVFEFRKKMEDKAFRRAFFPIEELIMDLRPDDGNFRFERLQVFAERLKELYLFVGKYTYGDIYRLAEKVRKRSDERARGASSQEGQD